MLALLNRLRARPVRLDAIQSRPAEGTVPAQSVNGVRFGAVDYRLLQNRRGHIDVVAGPVNSEFESREPSDLRHFPGATRYRDDGRPAAWQRPCFPDVIALAPRKVREKAATIYSPGEFARAVDKEQGARPRPGPPAAPK